MSWANRAKDRIKSGLVVLALVAAFFVWIGVLAILHHSTCGRLDAERVLHLEPGHDTAGPGSIYVKGVGRGPPDSELIPYLEAEEAMKRAGCEVAG